MSPPLCDLKLGIDGACGVASPNNLKFATIPKELSRSGGGDGVPIEFVVRSDHADGMDRR